MFIEVNVFHRENYFCENIPQPRFSKATIVPLNKINFENVHFIGGVSKIAHNDKFNSVVAFSLIASDLWLRHRPRRSWMKRWCFQLAQLWLPSCITTPLVATLLFFLEITPHMRESRRQAVVRANGPAPDYHNEAPLPFLRTSFPFI